jgi:DNA-binding MarR family transcriptional regulator
MYANFLRYVEEGSSAADVKRRARSGDGAFQVACAGMSRWGYVRIRPDPADPREKPPRSAWLIQPTAAGRQAQAVWAPLFAEIEGRWADRFGAAALSGVRAALLAIAGDDRRAFPDYLPVVRWGLFAEPLARTVETRPDAEDLSALLSKALQVACADYEAEGKMSLPVAANVLRLLDDGEGAAVRDLPRLSGVSKGAVSTAFSYLRNQGLIEQATFARVRQVRLTPRGAQAKAAHAHRMDALERDWRGRFGDAAVDDLTDRLLAVCGGRGLADSPLAAGLVPPPTGWRARVPAPEQLPFYPTVLHRGGYPDGA